MGFVWAGVRTDTGQRSALALPERAASSFRMSRDSDEFDVRYRRTAHAASAASAHVQKRTFVTSYTTQTHNRERTLWPVPESQPRSGSTANTRGVIATRRSKALWSDADAVG